MKQWKDSSSSQALSSEELCFPGFNAMCTELVKGSRSSKQTEPAKN
jgi:hypothetical protein